MRKFLALFLFVSFIISPAYSQDAAPGDVIVVLRSPAGFRASSLNSAESIKSLSEVKSFTESLNVNITKTYEALSGQSGNIFMVVHSDTKNENDLLREVRANPNVVAASLNSVMHLCADSEAENIPNDPEYFRLWGLEDIHAPEVWNVSTGSDDVYVAVIDSGVDYNHPDLKDNFSHKYSKNFAFTSDVVRSGNTDPDDYIDYNDHGTHVAGTIAAVGNNGIGVVGVNWKAKIIALRTMSPQGSGYMSDIISAINYLTGLLAADPKLNIASVNMSLGGYTYFSPSEAITQNEPRYLALKVLSDMNRTVICVAAGNDTNEVGAPVMNTAYRSGSIRIRKGMYFYPSSYTGIGNMIVVGASDIEHTRAAYSNYSSNFVHVAAPGGSVSSLIFSTIPTNKDDTARVYPYGEMQGTSMATPHVAGTAALLKAIYPEATASQIKAAILGGANSEYFTDNNTSMYGLLDIQGAVRFLADTLTENTPPKITASKLHNPITNQPYNFELTASGTEPITWSIEGELPAGLSLDEEGHITGIAEKGGFSEFVITAENDYGYDSMVFTLSTDNGVPPVISTSGDIEPAYTGVSYDVTPRISAGTWPILWSIARSDMPSGFGLSIDKNLGTVTFTPTSEGTYHFTVKAENFAGEAASEYNVTVKPSLAPVINDKKTLKYSVVGISYGMAASNDIFSYLSGSTAEELISADGALPILFDVIGLPKGMSFATETSYSVSHPSGVASAKIYGTPEESGSFDITITAKNAFGAASRDFMLYVEDNIPPVFSATAPVHNYKMQAGIHYQPSGLAAIVLPARAPLNFSVEGTLPEGITCSRDVDGVISFSGIPEKTGTYHVTLHASNELGADSRDVTITVTDPAIIATNFLPEAVKGESYDFTLSMFDGAACSWDISGNMPAGLTLSESGRISGIPAESGKFSFSITATLKNSVPLSGDSVSNTRDYTLTVRDLPEVITSSLPDGKMNTPYSRVTLSADGTAPITWSVSEGSLPAGLTLTGNGYILGTPAESGAFVFTLRASNGAGYADKIYTLSIESDGSDVKSEDVKPESPDVKPESPDISPDVRPDAKITAGSPRGVSSVTLGEASVIAEEGGIIAAVLPEISVSVSDSYSYSDAEVFANVKISDDVPVGYVLKWHPFVRTAAGETTEDSEKDSAVFYDSDGNIITAVPANRIVNVSSWLEAGKVYMPVISAVRNENAANVSSSGGGCDSGLAGFGVLAAVIYLFKKGR